MAYEEIETVILNLLREFGRQFYRSDHWIYSITVKNKIQGWKIHISSNQDNLKELIKKTIPILAPFRINFKIIRSYDSLEELNEDIRQIGKVITIYPKSDSQAVKIVKNLKPILANSIGPKIITDKQVEDCKVIQYRYGSFSGSYLDYYGKQIDYIMDEKDRKVPDDRTLMYHKPPWVNDPFTDIHSNKNIKLAEYNVVKYLLKKNKLVYLAYKDKQSSMVIIKQARKFFRYRNGAFQDELLRNEFKILSKLDGLYGTPKPVELFEEDGIVYFVIQAIESASLYRYIEDSYYSCSILNDADCLFLVTQITNLLSRYHKRNLILGDLNPNNIIIDSNGKLRFIDFEYSHFENKNWYVAKTEGFSPPIKFVESDKRYDLYCLISTILFITTGRHLYSNKKNLSQQSKFYNYIKTNRPSIYFELRKILENIYKTIKKYDANE